MPRYRRDRGEELCCFRDAHLEHVCDVLALEAHLQRLSVVALALTDLTGYVHVRKEVHLDLNRSLTRAGLAAAPAHVEREPSRLITPALRIRGLGEQFADVVEHAGVGGGVGAG